jgi:predicted Zn-dependent protease
MKNKISKIIFSLTLALTLFLTACATGNREPSDAQINAEAANAYADIKAKSKISHHPVWEPMVQRVAQRIAQNSGEKFNWEYVLIESPEVNAWCMPGGKIAVYTGIMPVLKTEAALAAVMGHEVAHATQRHGKKQYARAMQESNWKLLIAGAAMIGGELLCKDERCRLLTGLGGAAAGLAIAFFDMKYSRTDETEADHVGQQLMAKAGYDPSEAIRLWERMGAAGGQKPPELLSTHPSDTRRRSNLQSWLPETNQIYQQAPNKMGLGASIPAR